MPIIEDHLEQTVLDWLRELGYSYAFELKPDAAKPERENYRQVILVDRLRRHLEIINPQLPATAIEEAVLLLQNPDVPGFVAANRQFHRWLRDGVPVEFQRDGETVGDLVRLVDFSDPNANEWLAVNQFSIQGLPISGQKHTRRPDVLIFLNGLPIVVIELKNPADKNADIWKAFEQLQNYKEQIPDLFFSNEILVVADGVTARYGSLTADKERFMHWRIIEGHGLDPLGPHRETETLVRGLLRRDVLLKFLRDGVLFEDEGGVLIKKIAGFHQYRAVQKAFERALEASAPSDGTSAAGDRKGGVVWHTQGSGKSITMALYAAKVLSAAPMKNPTIVCVTDRNDLDGQLFETFGEAHELLRQTPLQATSRAQLRHLLKSRPAGGVIFTTIQKFLPFEEEDAFPQLSDRENIVVICDEAHRTQYGITGTMNRKTGVMQYGLAKHMRDALPHATFIAFTGTPVSLEERDTQATFGPYVDVYDMQMAQQDGAIVPIYYDSHPIPLDTQKAVLPLVDEEVAELTEDEEESEKAKLTTQWTETARIAGLQPRLEQLGADLVAHFEKRVEAMGGKAMAVCMSRENCVRLYDEIIKLRPAWHSDDPAQGEIKVIMTGSASDKSLLRPHIYSRQVRKDIEKRFKDPDDELKLVIVRDMWLTGFDVPPLHTLYVDKIMQGHTLMQAIARVNRVFRDKPGGLVMDYIGIANELKEALRQYASADKPLDESGDLAQRVLPKLKEHLETVHGILHGFDWSDFATDGHLILGEAVDHILGLAPDSKGRDGKQRFSESVRLISRAFALCATLPEAIVYREEIAFLQAIEATLHKGETVSKKQQSHQREEVVRQLMSKAVASEGVQDLFALVGLEKPNIGLLSEAFLKEVTGLKQKNVAVELLERLLRDEIRTRAGASVVQNRKFSEKLEESLVRYHNRAIETAQVIEELVQMAREFNAALNRGESLGLSNDEVAFYDALLTNEAALQEMSDEALKAIARELTTNLRNSVTVDWNVREAVRARLRLMVKRTLRKYKYPPDAEKRAIDLVLEQAEASSEQWAN